MCQNSNNDLDHKFQILSVKVQFYENLSFHVFQKSVEIFILLILKLDWLIRSVNLHECIRLL